MKTEVCWSIGHVMIHDSDTKWNIMKIEISRSTNLSLAVYATQWAALVNVLAKNAKEDPEPRVVLTLQTWGTSSTRFIDSVGLNCPEL